MATKKVALSEILWEAANKFLDPTTRDFWKSSYSCNAVKDCCNARCISTWAAIDFLVDLGVDPWHDKYTFGTRSPERRQGIRYMWLLLAMHVAEDEGIMVEVPA